MYDKNPPENGGFVSNLNQPPSVWAVGFEISLNIII